MRILLILITVILISSCLDNSGRAKVKAEFKCSDDQWVIMVKQYNLCASTSYISTYCYDQARAEQCDIITKID